MQVVSQVRRVAETKATVLIRGESGVGKELVARAIHAASPRRDAPFVCLNCAALTETLLESELFGHEKGAFTGATERMIGKFEAADQGTIFLDEIGEMALCDAGEVPPRAGRASVRARRRRNTPIKVDVRVVAATNRPLEEAVRAGHIPPRPVLPPAGRADSKCRRFATGSTTCRSWPSTSSSGSPARPAARSAASPRRPWRSSSRIPLARQRPRTANVIERAVALGTARCIDAPDIWLSELDAGSGLVAAAGAVQAGIARRSGEAAHPGDAQAHRLEQVPGRRHPRHRTLDAGSQDQGVWVE